MSQTAVREETDTGLFGPGSMTWRVHLELVMWVAGMRALQLQALHPRVMLGTYQNSALFDRGKSWQRFERTVEFVAVRTFGGSAEVADASARVRAIHARLRGYDPERGEYFRLDEQDHLMWVHCCEIDSYLDVARRTGILDSRADADRYLAESVRAAEVVGIEPGTAPASLADLKYYFRSVRPGLHAIPEARDGLRASLNPPLPRELRAFRPLVPPLGALAFSTLPHWARRLYGGPGLPGTDVGATLALRALRRTLRLLPEPPAPELIQRARAA